MYLLGLGLLVLVLRWQAVGPFADLSWWWVAAPFVAAALWWQWADASGYTKRRAMERDEQRKDERRERQREALGRSRGGKSRRR